MAKPSNLIEAKIEREAGEYILIRYIENCQNTKTPETVDEAVDILFNLLTCEFGEKIINMNPIEFIAKYHYTLGLYIRNCFGLWRKDSKIMEELNVLMPDDASAIIMEMLWRKFRRECNKKNYTAKK